MQNEFEEKFNRVMDLLNKNPETIENIFKIFADDEAMDRGIARLDKLLRIPVIEFYCKKAIRG